MGWSEKSDQQGETRDRFETADEKRWALIAKIQGKTWTAIYTVRDESVRLISVRRARTKEVRLYEEKTAGRSGG